MLDRFQSRLLQLLLLCSAACLAAADCQAEAGKPKESVVAEAAGQKITEAELRSAVREYLGREAARFTAKDLRIIKRNILEKMIARVLLSKAADIRGIKADPERAEAEEQRIEALVADLKQHGPAGELKSLELQQIVGRKDIETDLKIFRYLEEVVFKLGEQGARRAQAEKPAEIGHPLEYRLRRLVLNSNGDHADLEQAKRIRAELLKKPDLFLDYVKRFSPDSRRKKNGETGFVTLNQLPLGIAAAVEKLQQNELSESLRTETGFEIVQLLEVRRGVDISPEEEEEQYRLAALDRKRAELLLRHLEILRNQLGAVVYFK